jgi:hypothetical protein
MVKSLRSRREAGFFRAGLLMQENLHRVQKPRSSETAHGKRL